MQKIVIHRAGGHEQLRVEEHPDPTPAPGEVVVRTGAIGVNYADCVVRMGLYESAKEYVGWPITPGFEVAGTVAAVGAGVEDLAIGAAVFGVTRFGGYATHVAVPRHQVFPLPRGFSEAEAAAFPAVFFTAYYALFELAHVRAGQTLLVHSAAGGVGTALCQLGKVAGCRVIGVVGGAHKVDTARAAGADVVIDKSTEPLWPAVERAAPRGCDVVLDANGVATLRKSYDHLSKPGRLVVYGFHSMMPRQGGRPNWIKLAWDFLRTPRFDPLRLTNENRSVLAFNLSYLFEERRILDEGMARMNAWIDEGRLRPPIVTTFPLARVADAHRAIESGRSVGKLVLVP